MRSKFLLVKLIKQRPAPCPYSRAGRVNLPALTGGASFINLLSRKVLVNFHSFMFAIGEFKVKGFKALPNHIVPGDAIERH